MTIRKIYEEKHSGNQTKTLDYCLGSGLGFLGREVKSILNQSELIQGYTLLKAWQLEDLT